MWLSKAGRREGGGKEGWTERRRKRGRVGGRGKEWLTRKRKSGVEEDKIDRPKLTYTGG